MRNLCREVSYEDYPLVFVPGDKNPGLICFVFYNLKKDWKDAKIMFYRCGFGIFFCIISNKFCIAGSERE